MFKNSFLVSIIAIAALAVSCSRDKIEELIMDTQAKAQVDDQNNFSASMDAAGADINLALEAAVPIAGRGQEILGIICDAAIVLDSANNVRTLTLTYDGSNACNNGTTRTGVIVISVNANTRWRNPGAVIIVSFQNFKITRTADAKSITINGTQTYTNVSGGLMIQLATLPSIVHRVESNGLQVTFDDNTQRTWNVAKERTFTYQNGVVVSSRGIHSAGGVDNIAEWGTNRFGASFTTSSTSPVVIRQDCNFRITSGALLYQSAGFSGTVLFGLNNQGAVTSCPGNGSYYLRITWTGPSGGSVTGLYPY